MPNGISRSIPMTEEERACFKLWTQGLSPNTVSAYALDLKLFKQFVKKPLEEVEPRDIQLYQTQMNTAPNSRQRRMASLKSFFKCFAALGYISKSPVRWSRSIRIRPNYAERYLEQDVVAQMIDQEPNPRNQLILQTLYTCGIRVSELCNLFWGNLTVNRKTNFASLYVYGKGGKERVITLTPQLSQSLLTYRGKHSNDAPIFTGRFDKPLVRSQVMRIVRQAAHRVGVRVNVSPHWLRHAHATHALQNGAPLHVVQHTLGHENLQTTSGYLHVRPNESSSAFLNNNITSERKPEL